MIIENFKQQDIQPASVLTKATWESELTSKDEQLRKIIYEAMVRYYYRSSTYSFKASKQGIMQGFLLAGLPTDNDISGSWLKEAVQTLPSYEQQLVRQYHEYLTYNSEVMSNYVENKDLLLLLFLSIAPGCGKGLLERVEYQARQHGLEKLFLWADYTCDFAYYYQKGFTKVTDFINDKMPELGQQKTIIFSKQLK